MALKHNKGNSITNQSSQAGLGLDPDAQQRFYDDLYGVLPNTITTNTANITTNAASIITNASAITALTARVATLEAADNAKGKMLEVLEAQDGSYLNVGSRVASTASITFTGCASTDVMVIFCSCVMDSDNASGEWGEMSLYEDGSFVGATNADSNTDGEIGLAFAEKRTSQTGNTTYVINLEGSGGNDFYQIKIVGIRFKGA